MDISNAYVLISDEITALESKAIRVFIEETEKRIVIRLKIIHKCSLWL